MAIKRVRKDTKYAWRRLPVSHALAFFFAPLPQIAPRYEAAILRALGGEHQLAALTDEELRAKILELRSLLAKITVRNHPLALVQESSTLADVQERAEHVHAIPGPQQRFDRKRT